MTDEIEIHLPANKRFDAEVLSNEPVINVGSLCKGLTFRGRKIIELTHEEATRILQLNEFPGDRVLSDENVRILHDQMKKGTFLWDQVQIIICKFNGDSFRMNGQHTCWARLHMPEKNYRACCTLMTYEAETEDDMRSLYSSIDRGKARTNGNVVVALLAGRNEFAQFNKRQIKQLAEAVAYWHWEDARIRMQHRADDRAFLMLSDYYALTTRVGGFLNTKKTDSIRHILRRPVIASMYGTFDKAPDISVKFWDGVADGELLTKEDPRMTLRNKLLTTSIAAGGSRRSNDQESASTEEVYRWCISGWNAYRQGIPIKVFKTSLDKPRPVFR